MDIDFFPYDFFAIPFDFEKRKRNFLQMPISLNTN